MPLEPFNITSLVNTVAALAIILMTPDPSAGFTATANAVAAVATAVTTLVVLGREMGLWRGLRGLLQAWSRVLRRWWRRWRGPRR